MRAFTVDAVRNNPSILAQLCEDLGLSKRGLSVLLRCEPKVVRAWEKGEHKPDPMRALLLCALHRAYAQLGKKKFRERLAAFLLKYKGGSLEQLMEQAIQVALGVQESPALAPPLGPGDLAGAAGTGTAMAALSGAALTSAGTLRSAFETGLASTRAIVGGAGAVLLGLRLLGGVGVVSPSFTVGSVGEPPPLAAGALALWEQLPTERKKAAVETLAGLFEV